ncbi:MAG: inosine/xanthosine triphosphatase [Thermoplasmata archaeon]|nr:MAG: inosine/xanthosine triphosphatase [Thermoplasmata archaeon]
MKIYGRVAVGGTFDNFHKGHEALLNEAFKIGRHVIIGITSDDMASKKGHGIEPIDIRRKYVIRWIKEHYPNRSYEIVVINDRYGPALYMEELDAIVVSPETYHVALKLNRERISMGLKPLEIVRISYVLADDLFPISSRRIRAGEIDRSGRRMFPIRVAIGSTNKSKVKPVIAFLRALFPRASLDITPVKVDSGVPEQPIGDETYLGAYNRAKSALESIGADYGIGIESGIFPHKYLKKCFIVYQVACVYDKYGNVSFGTSKGFMLSESMAEEILKGKTLGDIAKRISGRTDINENEGIVGFISRGVVTRYDLSYDAVKAAFIPRFSPEYYKYNFNEYDPYDKK